MPRDEMRQPLKRQRIWHRMWRRRPGALTLASAAVMAGFATGGWWLQRIPAPLAGQPVVMAGIPEQAEIITSSTTPAADAAPPADEGTDGSDGPDSVIDQNGVEIIGGDGTDAPVEAPPEEASPPPRPSDEAMVILAPHRPLRKAPIDTVTEKTDDGPLPRVAADGKKPFDAYSQPTPLAVMHSDRPKITLVLGGMGLNAKLTAKAIAMLPGDVTLGFAPYGKDLQAQVNKARAEGHEVLLQVPMEPVGYPGSNPGPSTLLSDATAEQNQASLRWLMSRFAGYSGITNYMGSRLLTLEDVLRPVMKELKDRGLVYLEDAGVTASQSAQVAQQMRLPVQRASMVIDADPNPAAIGAALARLEKEAARNGMAIATGSGLEVTIETVADWAKTLQEKGIILVPVSTAYRGRAS